MATGPLATSIEASLNFNGVIYALDDVSNPLYNYRIF